MFWNNFIKLCVNSGKSPTSIGIELGFSRASVSNWKDGGIPRETALLKIADYFGVTTAYLLNGDSDKEKATNLEEKGRQAEFADLFSRLTPEQQKMLMAQMKGLLSE